jgi:transcriptional regulator with XRE-family HTH domain
MDYSLIKKELGYKSMSVRDLCFRIDVTEQGLHQMIRKKSMKIDTLERISTVLGLPVTYWFEDTTNAGNMLSKENVSTARIGRHVISKVSHEKIDSLTKNLNEMLKEMAAK